MWILVILVNISYNSILERQSFEMEVKSFEVERVHPHLFLDV